MFVVASFVLMAIREQFMIIILVVSFKRFFCFLLVATAVEQCGRIENQDDSISVEARGKT